MSSNCSCSRATATATATDAGSSSLMKYRIQLENWLPKQSLPVAAAVGTLSGAVRGAVLGFVVDVLFDGALSTASIQSPSAGGTLDPDILSRLGGYQPLIQSFVAGRTLEQCRNFAVMMGVNGGISCVMKKLRGKNDVQTSMVSGFGSGVVLSLVTGMKGPSVISVGVLFALVNGGLFKVEENSSQQRTENVLHNKTRDMFSCIGFGLDNYSMNFNKRLLTDNSLPLLTDRKVMKKGGRRA